MLTSVLPVSEANLYYWQVFYLSVHEKLEKNLQCWQVFYLSGNEILFFFRKIFIFRYHWQVKYLSAIQSSNHLLLSFFDFDRCFTCQWPTFYVLSYCLTGVLPVSDNIWYSLTGTLPVSDYFYLLTGGLSVSVIEILFDRYFTCQWWILTITDRWFTCQ